MKKFRKNKKGFTLVELIVVIAILAILALILIPALTGYVGRANKSKDEANANALYSQAMLIWSEDNTVDEAELKTKLEAANPSIDFSKKPVNVVIKDGLLESVTYGDFTFPKTEKE